MAKMLPSAVVEQIDKLFPNLAGTPRIGYSNDHRTALGTVLEFYGEIPKTHFASLSREDHTLLKRAVVALRMTVERWNSSDEKTLRLMGAPALESIADFGNRNALQLLRAILAEKCPDEAPDEKAPGLGFLGDDDLAATLRQDMTTARSTLANGEFKAACVMAGSVIEALLLWALKRKSSAEREAALAAWQATAKATGAWAPNALPGDWDDWKLTHLINVARRIAPAALLSPQAADAARAARDFRNLIHPERADRTKPTLGIAEIAVGAMGRVAEELEALGTAGRL